MSSILSPLWPHHRATAWAGPKATASASYSKKKTCSPWTRTRSCSTNSPRPSRRWRHTAPISTSEWEESYLIVHIIRRLFAGIAVCVCVCTSEALSLAQQCRLVHCHLSSTILPAPNRKHHLSGAEGEGAWSAQVPSACCIQGHNSSLI